jgi:transposase
MGKRAKPEEIVAKLRQVEVLTAQGKSIAEAARLIGVSEQTYYRWRAEFGSMKTDQVKRLKELELENTRLRRAVSDLTLDKLILTEAARGNY